jgi:acrylyl-CoA reductase (NADPH)
MAGFKALRIDRTESGQLVELVELTDEDLPPGDVTVRVEYSTVNYKDGLALTGRAPVVRQFPLVPGIDFAGTVEASSHPSFSSGDQVVLNGWGLGETRFGGFAERARVPGDWLVPLPPDISTREAMAIGTAGYTAMLCILALERHGLGPAAGPAVVTGATGGVGSIGVALLARAGWHVIASTGRPQERAYLEELGATEIIERSELEVPPRPLAKERWAFGIDSVGGRTLANLLSMTKAEGAVAACGLAGGMDVPTSVAPFILRGVALLGVNSVTCSMPVRLEAWRRLARDLDRAKLAAMTSIIGLDQVVETGAAILDGKVRGRVVVAVAPAAP